MKYHHIFLQVALHFDEPPKYKRVKNRGYYTAVQRYEFYFQVVKIFYE